MCWIGEERLAVSGIGADDLVLIPGMRISGFVPTHHHPASRELVAVDGDTLVRWRMP